MKSQENIVSYTLEEVLELNRRGATGSDWERVNSMSEAEIERLAAEDMEVHGFSADTYEHGYFTTEPLVRREARLHSIKAGTDNLIIAEIVSHAIAILQAIPGTSRAPGVVHAVLGSSEHAYEVSFTTAANA